jgi:hypothetical protein
MDNVLAYCVASPYALTKSQDFTSLIKVSKSSASWIYDTTKLRSPKFVLVLFTTGLEEPEDLVVRGTDLVSVMKM